MANVHEQFVLANLRALGLETTLNWGPDDNVGTFFITLTSDAIERLFSSTRKGASMCHLIQRKEKSDAQKERYVPAMNNGWWCDYASDIEFVVYPDASGEMQFKLVDGYQRTASAMKAQPPKPLRFLGKVHIVGSEGDSDYLMRHFNLGQQKSPDDNILGAHAFSYVHATYMKMAKNIATRIRYWNSNARGQILPDEWTRLSSELELPLKAFERMTYLVKGGDGDDFETAAIDNGLGGKELHTVYARLVGLLYQAHDAQKAKKFCEMVLQNDVPSIDPRLLYGESLNSVSKMVMDAYATFCDPSFESSGASSKKNWPWEEFVPPVLDWPVFKHGAAMASV